MSLSFAVCSRKPTFVLLARRIRCGRHVQRASRPSQSSPGRHSSTLSNLGEPEGIHDVRNIGIIAHVDAGKTTTTERMLFFSGFTARAGEVDNSNTVTDFLPVERQRKITVQSAAVTFTWPPPDACPAGSRPCTVNLIDTPGHLDFRFEVDRCLPILDGAVCIMDAVEGVEAHTERVWASAHRHRIPRIVYVNKCDRLGASFHRSVKNVASRLNGWPLVCQIPWWGQEDFRGVIDLVEQVGYRWKNEKQVARFEGEALASVLGGDRGPLMKEMRIARQKLIEAVAERDDEVMSLWMENPDEPGRLTPGLLRAAIRRLIRPGDGRVVPVFAGSSLHNIGVTQLMDAVVDYLPSPAERPDLRVQTGSGEEAELGRLLETAHAGGGGGGGGGKRGGKGHHGATVSSVSSIFKVFNHPTEGILHFVRVYYGTIGKNSPLWNTRLGEAERPMGLLQIAADKTENVRELATGHIGALRGLRKSRTGDTILTVFPTQKHPPEPVARVQIRPPEVPMAVATLAIETYGDTVMRSLQETLENLSREDPSLQWTKDENSGQFLVQGMGKLHLEIARDNIRQRCEARDKLTLGDVQVEYRETVTAPTGPHRYVYERNLAGKPGRATVTVSLDPREEEEGGEKSGGKNHRPPPPPPPTTAIEKGNNLIELHIPGSLRPSLPGEGELEDVLVSGVKAGLARGVRSGYAVERCRVTVELDGAPGATEHPTPGHLIGAVRLGIQEALRHAHAEKHVAILEPVMLTRIRCPSSCAGTVQHDITAAAGGHVLEVRDVTGLVAEGDEMSEEAEEGGEEGGARERVDETQVYAPPDPYKTVSSLRGDGVRGASAVQRVEIVAKVPLAQILDYDAHLRAITEGRHSMDSKFFAWEKMVGTRAQKM